MGLILSADEFEEIAATGLSAEPGGVIETAILREEADLARLIGPLVGPVTFRLHPRVRSGGPLCLPRFAATVTDLAIDDEELDPDVDVTILADGNGRRGGCIERTTTTAWGGIVSGSITVDDEPLVEAYLIEAVRLALVPDHERVVAEDRATAAQHRDDAGWMLGRALARLRPVPRAAGVQYAAERVSRIVL